MFTEPFPKSWLSSMVSLKRWYICVLHLESSLRPVKHTRIAPGNDRFYGHHNLESPLQMVKGIAPGNLSPCIGNQTEVFMASANPRVAFTSSLMQLSDNMATHEYQLTTAMDTVLMLIHVDDIQLFGTPAGIQQLSTVLGSAFMTKSLGELGEHLYLGLHLIRDRPAKQVFVGQPHYASQVR